LLIGLLCGILVILRAAGGLVLWKFAYYWLAEHPDFPLNMAWDVACKRSERSCCR